MRCLLGLLGKLLFHNLCWYMGKTYIKRRHSQYFISARICHHGNPSANKIFKQKCYLINSLKLIIISRARNYSTHIEPCSQCFRAKFYKMYTLSGFYFFIENHFCRLILFGIMYMPSHQIYCKIRRRFKTTSAIASE